MDRLTPDQRSRNMSRIRSSGTSPERRLGELLHVLFPEEAITERPALPGKPDYFLPRLNLAVFADGCFWHGCPKHHRLPEDNRPYWEEKIRRNRARDRRASKDLRAMGVRPVRVWEHELGKDLGAARRKIRRAAREAAKMSKEEVWKELCAWFLVRREGEFASLKPGDVFNADGKELVVVAVEGTDLRCREATDEERRSG